MTGTPGRPLSSELSEQLVSVAVDILAEEGWGRLNSDRIAARARAGKAGIYRRWPSMSALARHAVGRFTLVETPHDSIVGAARHEEDLRAGLDTALVKPLAAAVAEIGARARARGEAVDPHRMALLGSVLEAFWWQRYTASGDGAMSADRVDAVLDEILLPIVATSPSSVGV
jgi:AcrR family transcriptional regulator